MILRRTLSSLLVLFLAVSCVETRAAVSARYVRWTITQKRGSAQDMQVAELQLLAGASAVAWPGGTTAAVTGLATPYANEGAAKLVDGSIAWGNKCNFQDNLWGPAITAPAVVTIDCGSPVTFDSYRYCTANDYSGRDPISWTLQVSSDGSSWTQVDSRSGEAISATRLAWTQTWVATLPVSISGTVFEDASYAGGAGRSKAASGGVGIQGAVVELYMSGGSDDQGFLASTTTDSSGHFSFPDTGWPACPGYYVRVAESSVLSTLGAGATLPVSTFVKGDAAQADAVGSFADYTTPDPDQNVANDHMDAFTTFHSLATVASTGSPITGIEFGFNFTTVCNVNDSGYGSLRQAVLNANAMSGSQRVVFMVPSGTSVPGSARADDLLTSGVAVFLLDSDLPTLSDGLVLDGTTQTACMGDTNAGTLGGGTVGVDAFSIATQKPEVLIRPRTWQGSLGLDIAASSVQIKGLALHGYHTAVRVSSGSGLLIDRCIVGMSATSYSKPPLDCYNLIVDPNSSYTSLTIQNSLIAQCDGSGLRHYNNNGGVWSVIETEIAYVGSQTLAMQHDNVSRSYMHHNNGYLVVNNFSGGLWENNTFVGHQLRVSFGTGFTFRKNILTGAGSGIHAANDLTITENSFYGLDTGSGALLINFGDDASPWRTPNDAGDADGILNFPVIESAKIDGGSLILKGWARPGAKVEFFVSDATSNGWGCGQTFVGSYTEGSGSDEDAGSTSYSGAINGVVQGADTTNRFKFTIPIPGGVALGTKLCATALKSGMTSEFSAQVTVTPSVNPPNFGLVQVVATFSDPVNATANPKAIPGAVMEYSSTISNSSDGSSDANALRFVAAVPAGSAFVVADIGAVGSGPVRFTDGTTTSGLAYTFTSLNNAGDDISFSNDGGATWTYAPVADSNGCDVNVTNIRVVPQGTFAGAAGTSPSCTIVYRCKVQ